MLRYRLARFNPQRGKSWGVSLDWFTCKNHIGVAGSKVWGHISKAWKVMAKGIYQLPPRTRMELLHSNIWWSDGVELINNGFEYARGLELYRKGIKCIDDTWDSEQRNFITWEEAKDKFGLTTTDEGDWVMLTDKIGRWQGRNFPRGMDRTLCGRRGRSRLGSSMRGEICTGMYAIAKSHLTSPCAMFHGWQAFKMP